MLKKSFVGVIVPEVAVARFGTITEGVHAVVIRDAIRMPQNTKSYAGDNCKIVVGEEKPLAIARPCFNQEVTTILFQLIGDTKVIFDHRSDFGWAKLNETFVSRKTGEIVMLDDAFVKKHGLKEFAGKYYIPNADPNKEIGIENAEAEAKCFDMLARVFNAAGLAGQAMNPASLIGKKLKIKVEIKKFSRPNDKFERFNVSGWYPVTADVHTSVNKVLVIAEPELVELPEDLPF